MDALSKLIDALRCLPGVGPKSARRMAWQLLKSPRHKGRHLASCLEKAMTSIVHCTRCNNYTESPLCTLCQNPARDASLICVIEQPSDLTAIEQSNAYNGSYFILMGKISPLDGLGPDDIGLPRLLDRVIQESVSEVIIALSPSVEGQITANFITEMLENLNVKISQLAHGIPSAGELEFLDGLTIGSALRNRFAVHA